MNTETASSQSPQHLEEAKIRLRQSLGNLESVVDERITSAIGSSENSAEIENIRQNLTEAQRQSHHLQEENHSLQSQMGELQSRQKSLQDTQYTVGQRLDGLIDDVEAMITPEGTAGS